MKEFMEQVKGIDMSSIEVVSENKEKLRR